MKITDNTRMQRMKIKLMVAAAATVVASSSMAQSAFEGFYGQIATGYENNTIASGSPTITGPGCTPAQCNGTGAGTATSGSAPLVLGLGYTFAASPQFTIGLGVDYSTLYQNTGNVSSVIGGPPASTYNYKISNRYNIFLTPGYAIDKDKLAYVKVGYSNEGIQANGQGGCTGNCSTNTANVSGYVLGLGYKQIITGGVYGFAEANYLNYSKPSLSASAGSPGYTFNINAGTPSAYNFLVGVGYKF